MVLRQNDPRQRPYSGLFKQLTHHFFYSMCYTVNVLQRSTSVSWELSSRKELIRYNSIQTTHRPCSQRQFETGAGREPVHVLLRRGVHGVTAAHRAARQIIKCMGLFHFIKHLAEITLCMIPEMHGDSQFLRDTYVIILSNPCVTW